MNVEMVTFMIVGLLIGFILSVVTGILTALWNKGSVLQEVWIAMKLTMPAAMTGSYVAYIMP